MAKVIDEKIKRQLEKKTTFFLKYFPVRIKNVGEDAVEARKLVWAFQDACFHSVSPVTHGND
ncbi:MAG: hypothetical protein ACLVEJ_00485 [Parabacteroides sp.]